MPQASDTDATSIPPPEPGEARPLLPGLLWVRMPLPFAPWNVNIWLLEDGEGWLAIDTGVQNEESVALWDRILTGGSLRGRPVTRLLVTHFHPDHAGLAGWLCDRVDAPLLMTRTEWLQARLLRLDIDAGMTTHQVGFARRAGAPEAYLDFVAGRGPLYVRSVAPLPRAYARLEAGAALDIGGRRWEIHTGAGHAPEMACLHCPELGLLIAADQILPRITPYVGVQAMEPEGDPLSDFLASNAALRALPEAVLVLPSHGEPFRGLHARIDALEAHHGERLDLLRRASAEAALTGFSAMGVLFRRTLDHRQMGFALGESLAHLHRLVTLGELRREAPADGPVRFVAIR